MKNPTKTIVIILLLSLTISTFNSIKAQTVDSTRDTIQTAYQILVETNNAGGNITELTNQLNQALNLLNQAENLANTNPGQSQELITEAQTIANNVIEHAKTEKEVGIGQTHTSTILLITSIIASIAAGIIIYLYAPKIAWKTWLNIRKNHLVKVTNSPTSDKNIIITAKQISALILGAIIIISLIAITVAYLPSTKEQFSELGILGPNMKLGDYPKETVAGETINLNGYVGNHMDQPMYYTFLIKLGDNTTTVNPAQTSTIQQHQKIILDNQTWTFPINLTLTEIGQDQRIIFELWIYNQTINQNQYHERWGQIWVNVNSPA
jgi:uncharacterized membrane protein